ncbi:hypothetical protein FRC04_011673 [Tulasnella sp. 424]|nr:hypothetical protein FRC04_011673 [Tulasnella sp. 424]
MPSLRVFTGDENGLTKSIKFSIPEGRIRADTVITTEVVTVDERPSSGKIQRMTVGQGADGSKLSFENDVGSEDTHETSKTTILPMRLKDWQLAPSETHFAYGGDEVEVSLWDSEKAFSESIKASEEAINSGKKRKERKDKVKLLHGEVWRAQNVPHDFLNIRQPVHNTALSFVHYGSTTSDSHNVIAAGTAAGAVRLYDIRSQRKPIQNWDKVSPNSGVKHIQCGRLEHQIFVTDSQSHVYTIDTRNGRTTYRYPSAKGAVVSLAPAPHDFLLSVSLDHFIRLYTTPPPPAKANQNQPSKGRLVHEEYLKGTPSVVVWDGVSGLGKDTDTKKKTWEEKNSREADEEEDIWNNMEVTGAVQEEDTSSEATSDEESEEDRPRAKRLKSS